MADVFAVAGGSLPKFDGIAGPSAPSSPQTAGPLRPQTSGGPIRVPPLGPDKVHQYSSLFEESGAQNGMLPGESAKQIFERAQLPNEVLGRIWNLVDTEQKGSLGLTEFIIAMHLLASYKNGSMRALPQMIPAGLYEAAARRGIPRQNTSSRPISENAASAIPRQFSGASFQRTSSPLAGPPQGQPAGALTISSDGWAISPQDKAQFDQIYATIDTANRGFITGDQAVGFFSNARLPEEALAQIWDLADINSEGQLNRDEFAVAMYLIRQQRSKRDGRDVLPQTLPQNLVPPTMRRQNPAPSQPTAPAFDNASNATAPKKASEDLFGLDALSSPPAPSIAPRSTGDSSAYAPSSARAQDSPQFQQPSQQQSAIFKPFVPSSSFGQTIMQPQATGSGRASPVQNRGPPPPPRQPSNMEDLLGDNDPEVSKRLTQETTELGNLSNQVSTLTGQMQENKSKRVSTERDLSQAQAQKRDFEARLGQLRGAYEQEVREVKALEDELAALRSDIQKLQQEMAMIGGSRQDLGIQRRQLTEALAQAQNERNSLKESIREANEAVAQLKPQVEKLKSDVRQQKGLVAIDKKQLATVEAELDNLRGEFEESTRDLHESTRELEDSQRSLEVRKRSMEVKPSQPPPSAVASPGGSASMNPFFRQRGLTGSSDRGVSSAFTPQNVGTPNHSVFDSFFGPALGSSTQPSTPLQTSVRTESPIQHREPQEPMFTGESFKSSEGAAIHTPAETPPPTSAVETPQPANVPPAPPKSRQITSSFLPFRSNLQRSDSRSSSVQVAPPASRLGDSTEFDMPSTRDVSFSQPMDARVDAPKPAETAAPPPLTETSLSSLNRAANNPGLIGNVDRSLEDTSQGVSPFPSIPQEGSRELPGAFPSDATPPIHPHNAASESSDDAFQPTISQPDSAKSAKNDPFSMASDKPQTPPSAKDDFDSAFAGFGNKSNGKAPEPRNFDNAFDGFGHRGKAPEPGTGATDSNEFGIAGPKSRGEFPPIREFGADDESDSDGGHGFDDDFTASSPPRPLTSATEEAEYATSHGAEAGESSLAPTRPPIFTSDTNTTQLPTPDAEARPPTYDQVASPPLGPDGQRMVSNQFPAEYTGLLPAREPLTSPVGPLPVKSPTSTTLASPRDGEESSNFFGGETRAEPMAVGPSFGEALAQHRSPMAPGASAAPYAYDPSPSQSRAPSQSQPQVLSNLQSQAQLPNQEQSRFEGEPQSRTPPPAQSQPPLPAKTAFDEFDDDDFGDLSEAKEGDDKTDDDLHASRRDGFDEFNPVFDSPAPSRSTAQPASSTFGDHSFHDFESSITSGQGYGPRQAVGGQGDSSAQPHDWDAIFAGLDPPQNNGVAPSPPAQQQTFHPSAQTPLPKEQQSYAPPPGPPPSSSAPGPAPELQRVLSEGNEHDDPILKRLTGMGYSRDRSLAALEKFDYNINKVSPLFPPSNPQLTNACRRRITWLQPPEARLPFPLCICPSLFLIVSSRPIRLSRLCSLATWFYCCFRAEKGGHSMRGGRGFRNCEISQCPFLSSPLVLHGSFQSADDLASTS